MGIMKSYRFNVYGGPGRWSLILDQPPWAEGYGTDAHRALVQDYPEIDKAFDLVEGRVCAGDGVTFTQVSPLTSGDQMRSMMRQYDGPIFEVHMPYVGSRKTYTLPVLIGDGAFFMQFEFKNKPVEWKDRFDVWKRMSAWERYLRQSLGVQDECGFGIGLRGILTGCANQATDKPGNQWEKSQMGREEGFYWMGPARLSTELKGVSDQLQALFNTEARPDESGIMLGLTIRLLGDYRAMMECYRKYVTAKPDPYGSWYDSWDETLQRPEWKAAMERVERYKNEGWTWVDSDKTPLKE